MLLDIKDASNQILVKKLLGTGKVSRANVLFLQQKMNSVLTDHHSPEVKEAARGGNGPGFYSSSF